MKNNNSEEISTSKRRLGELKGTWWRTKGSSVNEDREKKFGEDIKSPGGLFIAHEPQPLPNSVSSLHRGCVVDKAASNESSPSATLSLLTPRRRFPSIRSFIYIESQFLSTSLPRIFLKSFKFS